MKIDHLAFVWDEEKETINRLKHGVGFDIAQLAFMDPYRIIAHDDAHSLDEARWFCIEKVDDHIITVRFTIRDNKIRLIGAECWRKWSKFYNERKKLH